MAFPWKRALSAVDRVVLSAISFVLALTLVNAFLSLRYGLGEPPDAKRVLQNVWVGGFRMLWYGWPGLILASPAILFLTDLRRWRFWALLVVGTAMGPIYLWLWLASDLGWRTPFGAGILKVSLPISGLASLIYLLLLRHAQRPRQGMDLA